MVKSKSSCLAKLPKEQRCKFLIGPPSTWFLANTTDIWTQPRGRKSKPKEMFKVQQEDVMDCDQIVYEDNTSLSYFIYGSIGCFCYGEIHHHQNLTQREGFNNSYKSQSDPPSPISALVNRLIDIKEDNSRVSCVRFLQRSLFPIAMVLTESGTLLIHDCSTSDNLIHFKKSELLTKFLGPPERLDDSLDGDQPSSKRPKMDVTQQVSSCLWPDAANAFIGISLRKENTNLLLWVKLKDVTEMQQDSNVISKTDIIESFSKLDLGLPEYSSPICCMQSVMLDAQVCLIAVGMDDGLISIVKVDFKGGQSNRVIKLVRHKDSICAMSFYTDNTKKFPSGLLASASRDRLVLVWDIENEFYFADYQAAPENRINWFALSFVTPIGARHINLAVSNCDNGLTVLELPENARSKIRLRENKDRQKKQGANQSLDHRALILNVIYDTITDTIMTTSLDCNHILWSCRPKELASKGSKKDGHSVEVKPLYLFPSMPKNSRTHMLRHSPIKEDFLGIAMGEAGVRFYKVSEKSMHHRFDMSPSCGLIARRITKASLRPTSLAWHPSHEYRLAIGTLEGKVLRVDLTPRKATLVEAEHAQHIKSYLSHDKATASSVNLPPSTDDLFGVEYTPLERCEKKDTPSSPSTTSKSDSNSADGVYSICWGPNPVCPDDISRLAIYAIGSISNRLRIYHNKKENNDKLTNYLDEFEDRSLPEAIGEASEVAWKSSMDLMALGTTTGKIIIVEYLDDSTNQNENNLFRKLAVIQGPLGNTYIQCLAWHPTTDKDDPRYYYIAASANESAAYVFNIGENMLLADVRSRLRIGEANQQEFDDAAVVANVVTNYLHKLEGHKKAISDIAWNPHEIDQLATSSFDRFCYVWSLDGSTDSNDKLTARIKSKFSARDRLFTLEWSLVDTDLIYTSGHDSTIWSWRPSENCSTKVD